MLVKVVNEGNVPNISDVWNQMSINQGQKI